MGHYIKTQVERKMDTLIKHRVDTHKSEVDYKLNTEYLEKTNKKEKELTKKSDKKLQKEITKVQKQLKKDQSDQLNMIAEIKEKTTAELLGLRTKIEKDHASLLNLKSYFNRLGYDLVEKGTHPIQPTEASTKKDKRALVLLDLDSKGLKLVKNEFFEFEKKFEKKKLGENQLSTGTIVEMNYLWMKRLTKTFKKFEESLKSFSSRFAQELSLGHNPGQLASIAPQKLIEECKTMIQDTKNNLKEMTEGIITSIQQSIAFPLFVKKARVVDKSTNISINEVSIRSNQQKIESVESLMPGSYLMQMNRRKPVAKRLKLYNTISCQLEGRGDKRKLVVQGMIADEERLFYNYDIRQKYKNTY